MITHCTHCFVQCNPLGQCMRCDPTVKPYRVKHAVKVLPVKTKEGH